MDLRTPKALGAALAVVLASAASCSDSSSPSPNTTTSGTGGNGAETSSTSGVSSGAGGGGASGVEGPPDAVSNLSAKDDGNQAIDITWTNPDVADLAGILLVRGAGVSVDFEPTDGTSYTVGQEVGLEQEVIYAELGEVTALYEAVPGIDYSFAAWAYDSERLYSSVETTRAFKAALGPQHATVQLALDGTLTVAQQPSHFHLSGSALVEGTHATLDLTVENHTARVVYNLKALYGSFNEGGTSELPSWPLTGGKPSSYYGLEPLAVGASRTRTVTLQGITGSTDPITIDLELVDAPMMYAKESRDDFCEYDTSNSGNTARTDMTPSQPAMGAVMSQDGSTLYLGDKRDTSISTFDLVTRTQGASAHLGQEFDGSVVDLVWDPRGNLYALINDGAHYWGGDGAGLTTAYHNQVATNRVDLVKLDAQLMEIDRIELLPSTPAGPVARNLAVAPDGSTLALTVWDAFGDDQLWFVDLATFELIDADSATEGPQPVFLGGDEVHEMAYSSGGDRVFVSFFAQTSGIEAVNTTGYTSSSVPYTGGGVVLDMQPVAGSLYLGMRGGSAPIYKLDGDMNQTSVTTGFDAAGQLHLDARGRLFATAGRNASGNGVAIIDPTTDTLVDTDGDSSNGATNGYPCFGQLSQHWMFITPF